MVSADFGVTNTIVLFSVLRQMTKGDKRGHDGLYHSVRLTKLICGSGAGIGRKGIKRRDRGEVRYGQDVRDLLHPRERGGRM